MSVTTAIRDLRKRGVRFTEHEYRYEDYGGTRTAAVQLDVDEHAVVKTLVMEDEARQPLIVLMHGDREVSTKQLARACSWNDRCSTWRPSTSMVAAADC